MDNTPEPSPSDDSEDFVVLLATPAEVTAVKSAIWYYLNFLRHFKKPTPIQTETARLLEAFQRRLPL